MTEARRQRAVVVVGILLVSMLLFGCDFFDGWFSTNDPGPREGESLYPDPADADSGTEDVESEGQQPGEAAPSDQEEGALTGAQDSPAMGPVTAQEIAGTYSASAALQHVENDVESADSLPVTLQLNDSGTGTASVNGYSGAAQYAGSSVSFSVTMEEGGQSVVCNYRGTVARSEDGSQIAITGTMNCSMMGVTFAYYEWTGYK